MQLGTRAAITKLQACSHVVLALQLQKLNSELETLQLLAQLLGQVHPGCILAAQLLQQAAPEPLRCVHPESRTSVGLLCLGMPSLGAKVRRQVGTGFGKQRAQGCMLMWRMTVQ